MNLSAIYQNLQYFSDVILVAYFEKLTPIQIIESVLSNNGQTIGESYLLIFSLNIELFFYLFHFTSDFKTLSSKKKSITSFLRFRPHLTSSSFI